MSYTKIPKDSWNIIERVLMRYPEQKEEYQNMREQLLESTPFNDGQPRGNYKTSSMEAAVKEQICMKSSALHILSLR